MIQDSERRQDSGMIQAWAKVWAPHKDPKAYYEAHKAERKAYRDANKEKRQAAQAAWRAKNPEKLKATRAAAYQRNREKKLAYAKAYAAAHKEQSAAYNAKYQAENKSKLAAYERAWTAKNLHHVTARKKAWRVVNKVKISQDNKAYRSENPEIISRSTHTRRARIANAGIGCPKVIAAWERKWRKSRIVICTWCTKSFKPSQCHLDHIMPIAKGGAHSIENLCIACGPCNLSKHAKTPEEWNKHITSPVLL